SRRSASARWTSLRSTWLPRTRRSPPAGSTPSRWPSARGVLRTARTRTAAAPRAIRKVSLPTGEDKNAGWGKPKRKRVISDGVAWTVTKILEENVQYGTGVGANYGAPAAGKTGTTEEHADAWFCGYTPRLGTTVWVGYPRGKVPM